MNDYANMFGSTTVTKDPSAPLATPGAIVPQMAKTAVIVAVKPNLPANILQIGSQSTAKLNDISNKVLEKVKVSAAGDFGKGVTEILALTETVDMSRLEEDKSLIGRMTNIFRTSRVKVLAQFDDVNSHVQRIADNLVNEIREMDNENKWLVTMYDENLQSVRMLQDDIVVLQGHLASQRQYVSDLATVDPRTQEQEEELQRERQIEETIERSISRLETQLQIGIMDAPDIRSLQKNNVQATLDYRDLIEVTIPSWKRQLTIALTAARQVRRAEQGDAIKNRNNDLIRKRADAMRDASIKTATLSQRSSVADVDTLEYAQNQLVARITEVRRIETEGRAQRERDVQRLRDNREKLKQEMAKW